MRTLDRSRPYGEVYGSDSGARFCQDGIDFNGDGFEVGAPSAATKTEQAPALKPIPEDVGDIYALHWRRIKAMVEMYGGEWTNKEAGIAYLRGQSA